jgi:DNA-directed RNA polymerase sigma subunit (sigma70/sigma32)
MFGLINAVDAFDWRYGVKFSTFGTKVVRNAIIGEMREQGLFRVAGGEGATISYDRTVGGEEGSTLLSLLEDRRTAAPESDVKVRDELESLRTAAISRLSSVKLNTVVLTQQAKLLLVGVLGLEGKQPQRIVGLAEALNISPEKAISILGRALEQIGVEFESKESGLKKLL